MVEIVAIVLAGAWAFYVFIYENRIKPSFTDLQTDVSATMQKTSQRDGATGVLLKTEFRNSGTVRFYFVGYAVTVTGWKMTLSPRPTNDPHIRDSQHTYFRLSRPTSVYGFGFITQLGDPKSATAPNSNPGVATARNTRSTFPQTDSICSRCTSARASQNRMRNRFPRGSSRASKALPT